MIMRTTACDVIHKYTQEKICYFTRSTSMSISRFGIKLGCQLVWKGGRKTWIVIGGKWTNQICYFTALHAQCFYG